MHPRAAILAAMRTALEGASSPARPVRRQDETANGGEYQVAAGPAEARGEQSTQQQYDRRLALAVTAWGRTEDERDEMSEDLELALLGTGALGALEVEWEQTELTLPPEQVGQRLYPATYRIVAQYFTTR